MCFLQRSLMLAKPTTEMLPLEPRKWTAAVDTHQHFADPASAR
jgi:hypothetical protein